jgi:hypothetical protein
MKLFFLRQRDPFLKTTVPKHEILKIEAPRSKRGITENLKEYALFDSLATPAARLRIETM